jgi:hypothetical protein
MQLSTTISDKIKRIVWRRIKDYYYYFIAIDPPIIRNINYNPHSTQKKVLVSYLTRGFVIRPEDNSGRTIIPELFKIVRVFTELGFAIDLVNCNDIKSIKLISDTKYDVLFGFGEVFFRMSEFQPNALTTLYMTEQHPEISYKEEQKRLDYFYERHNKRVPIVRSGQFYKIEHLKKKYNSIITLSELEPLKQIYSNPYPIFPTGIVNSKFTFLNKDHSFSRTNFLWLGSSAVIHKGLDLLIDVFSKRDDVSLHICGLNAKARKLLNIPKKPNIYDYGHIDIQSETFLELVDKCTYSILPSCAEGCATSITTCMLHGLIPVVNKDAGFNRLSDNALFLEDFKIEYLDNIINELSNYDDERLSNLRERIFLFARSSFILSTFEANFRTIISDIIKKNG